MTNFLPPKKLPNEGEQCKQTMQRSLKTEKPWKCVNKIKITLSAFNLSRCDCVVPYLFEFETWLERL